MRSLSLNISCRIPLLGWILPSRILEAFNEICNAVKKGFSPKIRMREGLFTLQLVVFCGASETSNPGDQTPDRLTLIDQWAAQNTDRVRSSWARR